MINWLKRKLKCCATVSNNPAKDYILSAPYHIREKESLDRLYSICKEAEKNLERINNDIEFS